jgi:hypothetical protein
VLGDENDPGGHLDVRCLRVEADSASSGDSRKLFRWRHGGTAGSSRKSAFRSREFLWLPPAPGHENAATVTPYLHALAGQPVQAS